MMILMIVTMIVIPLKNDLDDRKSDEFMTMIVVVDAMLAKK